MASLKRDGRELYTINGEVVVDRIFRFESLEEDLRDIFERLDVAGKPELPRTKSSFRPQGFHYRALYGDGDRMLVAELFRDEIETMGYTF